MKIEIGNKIGRWEILERLSKNGRVYYHCICECGTIKDVRATHFSFKHPSREVILEEPGLEGK